MRDDTMFPNQNTKNYTPEYKDKRRSLNFITSKVYCRINIIF